MSGPFPMRLSVEMKGHLAFLSGHSFLAEGDDCMVGPHRPRLLERGALDKLLEAALTKDQEEATFKVIQHSAAVGVMYLSTMAGTVSAKVGHITRITNRLIGRIDTCMHAIMSRLFPLTHFLSNSNAAVIKISID
eukprot:scaffold125306_cov22-Prasinocladus_malaysianus.AAC.1